MIAVGSQLGKGGVEPPGNKSSNSGGSHDYV
jgi:hypothetical protein